MKIRLIRASALPIALLAALVVSPQGQAADTMGQAYEAIGGAGCTYASTRIQTDSPGGAYAAPYDGVITSWASRGFWRTVTFKVVRLGSGSSYAVLASDGPRTHAPGSELETYPTRVRVRQGDVIGAYVSGPSYCAYSNTGYEVGEDDQDVPAGATGLFDAVYDDAAIVPIEATIERDRDGDGFGDETQDACPTNAATAGPCPLPTTLGRTFTPAPSYCGGSTIVVHSSPGVVHAAPADGVVTSWSYQAGTTVDGSLRLKVLRPLGGTEYRAIGEVSPQVPSANVLNTWPARIPVRQGDKIGLSSTGVECHSNVADWQLRSVYGDLALGLSAPFDDGATSRALDLSAVVEADADGDGFGDTSQDACPTDASAQADCPAAQPPADQACKTAKKKLAKAKAKLKKLKRKGAAAKKLKAAKKKVKKAKAKVEAAC